MILETYGFYKVWVVQVGVWHHEGCVREDHANHRHGPEKNKTVAEKTEAAHM